MATTVHWDPSKLNPKQRALLTRAARLEYANRSFLGFTRWINPEFRVNWHHRLLAKYLEEFARGNIRRLMIFAPPRHGKSELVSRILPAFIFSIRPRSSIIACSYSARLASKMNLDAQRFLDSGPWEALRPGYGLSDVNIKVGKYSAKRNSDEFEIQDNETGAVYGSYSCAGVGGSITGMGADYALIDDPIKDAAQASSALQRDNLWDWYGSTLYTRLQNPGSVLLMSTRWDEDDLAGRLLRAQERDSDADQWVVLNLPAIYEEGLVGLNEEDPRPPGAALWPARYSLDQLRKIRASIGPRWWNALYQGSPSELEGSLFKRDWFKYYDSFLDFGGIPSLKEVAFSADLSFKGDHDSDYVVFQVWGRDDNKNYFLLDQVRGKWDFVDTMDQLDLLRQRWPSVKKLFLEDKANGSALGSMLKKRLNTNLRIIPINPDSSKVLRYYAIQPIFEEGRVYLPRKSNWIEDYEKELTTVRGGPNNKIIGAKNDDQVDTTAQILLQWDSLGSVDPTKRIERLELLTKL